MDVLQSSDLRMALEFVKDTGAPADVDDFTARTLDALPRLVPADIAGIHRLDLRTGRNAGVTRPDIGAGPDEFAVFDRYTAQHPIIARFLATRDGRALRFSDLISRRAFHRLELYDGFYRRIRVEHQLGAVVFHTPAGFVGCALNRPRRDFSERDRLLLDLVRPHLVRAYENASSRALATELLASLERGIEDARRAVILLSPDGRVARAGTLARQWLAAGSPGACLEADRLPAPLEAWLRSGPCDPHVLDLCARRVIVRLLPRRPGDRFRILLLEEQRDHIAAEDLVALGLSDREAAVLSWVARGRSDAEIATILSLSPRTVAKHLEHVYEKLDVHSRTAAVACVLAAGGGGRTSAPPGSS